MEANNTFTNYEVLSPWAEVDPVPMHGVVPRVADLAGRKVGLFANVKRAAPALIEVIEEILQERLPNTAFSRYLAHKPNVPEMETDYRGEFQEWLAGVDTVVAAVGD